MNLALKDIQDIFASGGGEGGEFVRICAGLHPKVADDFKGGVLGENADIEDAGFLNDFPGVVSVLDGHSQPGGSICHLNTGVADAAIVLFSFGSQKE